MLRHLTCLKGVLQRMPHRLLGCEQFFDWSLPCQARRAERNRVRATALGGLMRLRQQHEAGVGKGVGKGPDL